MPEMSFTVRWPDGSVDDLYSPSLVVHDHLDAGATYSVEEFTERTSAAMCEASERVRATFGFACTSADATRADVLATASSFRLDDTVEVVSLVPPLQTSEDVS
jgi:uncharacterized repeat protein (TIGR04042 family)